MKRKLEINSAAHGRGGKRSLTLFSIINQHQNKMTTTANLFTSYLAILLSESKDPNAVEKEVDVFLSNLEAIDRGNLKPKPITLAEYLNIVSTGNDFTNFGDKVENLDYIRDTKDRESPEFLSFSELHRFSKRIQKYL